MNNPNNCSTCKHKQNNPDGGWCYMFPDEPDEVCMKHTGRKQDDAPLALYLKTMV